MFESHPYRADLEKYAASFKARQFQQLWREDSLSKAEKMLFVGFLFVRKLIECNKVTDSCARSNARIFRSRIQRKREVSSFLRHDLYKDLDEVQWNETRVDVHQLADKIIHTWWIIPAGNEENGLEGFVFTTDRKRNTELWLVPTNTISEIFMRFANSPIENLEVRRDANGRLTYWRAL